jgi:hypothetical protein
MNAALETAREEAEAIIDTHMVSKVSGGKVAREAANSVIMAGSAAAALTGAGTVFAGLHFARGPAYSVQAFVERYRKAGQERARGEREAEVTATNVIKEGFTEWWGKLHPKSSIRDKRQALATLTRTLGIGAVSGLAIGGAAVAETFDIDAALDRAVESVKHYAGELYTQNFAGDITGAPVAEAPGTGAPDVAPLPGEEGIRFRGEIPEGSRVMGGSDKEGITYVLSRVIKANPGAYGFDGESDLSADLFAKRLAIQIAQSEGQMRRWLTDKAIGKLNLFPEFINGEWHMSAVVDGKKLSMAELEARGFTSAAPASSK